MARERNDRVEGNDRVAALVAACPSAGVGDRRRRRRERSGENDGVIQEVGRLSLHSYSLSKDTYSWKHPYQPLLRFARLASTTEKLSPSAAGSITSARAASCCFRNFAMAAE